MSWFMLCYISRLNYHDYDYDYDDDDDDDWPAVLVSISACVALPGALVRGPHRPPYFPPYVLSLSLSSYFLATL